ncbi:MAG: GFA family protein [Myxococcales bacterium]|nr:MAG: GFA family protein [Myxococcales bacterium]
MKQAVAGSCHCRAVQFRCQVDLSAPTTRCNCSICTKGRYWFAAVLPADFELLAGGDALADYRFGSHGVAHRFCRTCGVKVFGEASHPALGGRFFAVSVVCLDLEPERLASLPVQYHDGRDGSRVAPQVTSYL